MLRNLIWAGVVIVCLIFGFVFGLLWNLDNFRSSAFVLTGLALGVVIGFIIDWLLEEGYRRNRELERQIEMMQQAPSLPAAAAINPNLLENLFLLLTIETVTRRIKQIHPKGQIKYIEYYKTNKIIFFDKIILYVVS